MQQLELLKRYAESWNTLDVSHLESCLAEDATIFSQTNKRIVAQGKTEVVNALQSTMTHIKEVGIKEKVYAEIGFCSDEMVKHVELYSSIQKSIPLPRIEIDQPCVVMAQKNKEKFISVVVTETENELIKSLFVCGLKIPSPTEVVRTGDYPGLKPLTQSEEEELAEIERNTIRRHLIWIDASHHEFLRVTKEDLITLNVWRNISVFSYGSENYAYLEEDCDAGIFLKAAEDAGWNITLERVELPRFPPAKFKGEKIGRLEEDPTCSWCRENKKDCGCPRLTCLVCNDEAIYKGEVSVDYFICGHLLAGWDNDEFVCSSLTIEDGISDENVNEHKWDEKELDKAFGDALPLYYCFREGNGNVESTEFWEVLTDLTPEIKSSRFYHTSADTMIGWGANMYFAENLVQVKKRVEMLLKRIKKGYQQLAESL